MPESTLVEDALQPALAALDDTPLSRGARVAALERFRRTPSGHERPGRYWKLDVDTLVPSAEQLRAPGARVTILGASDRVIACDLRTAAADHPNAFARAFGATGVHASKFGALAAAFSHLGAFVYVPAETAVEPIVVRYDVAAGSCAFPATVIYLERGAHAIVIERFEGGCGAFVAATAELIVGEGAQLTLAGIQNLDAEATFVATRAAHPHRNASIAWANADLGAALASTDTTVTLGQPGADAQLTSLFFPVGAQHVETISTVDHLAGDATSQTVVKSAASGTGQARYLGNIRIAAGAQGTDASLRDDALLLSKAAHIDSIPALEIAANDVRAYHGATVGAIDDFEIFYMESRGIERGAAERMIALGFFEPAIERFPTSDLRDELRAALAAKIG